MTNVQYARWLQSPHPTARFRLIIGSGAIIKDMHFSPEELLEFREAIEKLLQSKEECLLRGNTPQEFRRSSKAIADNMFWGKSENLTDKQKQFLKGEL